MNPLTIYPEKKYDTSSYVIDRGTDLCLIEKVVRDELLSMPLNSFVHRMNFKAFIAMIKEITGYKANTPKLMFPLLKKIIDSRYREIIHMLNADGVSEEKQRNTYMDALHLWAAEEAECDVFLTDDGGIRTSYIHDSLFPMNPENLLLNING